MSADADPVLFVLDLQYEIYSGCGPSTYMNDVVMYYVVCYRAITALYVGSVGCLLCTLVD